MNSDGMQRDCMLLISCTSSHAKKTFSTDCMQSQTYIWCIQRVNIYSIDNSSKLLLFWYARYAFISLIMTDGHPFLLCNVLLVSQIFEDWPQFHDGIKILGIWFPGHGSKTWMTWSSHQQLEEDFSGEKWLSTCPALSTCKISVGLGCLSWREVDLLLLFLTPGRSPLPFPH